jgi:hypothetical protein
MDTKDIWVGVFGQTNVLIVFDPAIQPAAHSIIYAFSVGRNVIREFDPNEIRKEINAVRDERRALAIEQYLQWKEVKGKEFLRLEPERDQRRAVEAIERKEAIARHRAQIEKLGFEYRGVEEFSDKQHRATHCYRCKKGLLSTLHIKCMRCGWLICECGACGCGYSS